jgi:TolB-like protein
MAMRFLQELKRRNVFKVGIAYTVTAWFLLQMTEVVSGILQLPDWAPKLILLILVVGLAPALIFAWAFELTPQGIKLTDAVRPEQSITRRTGRKLDYTIIVLLGLSLGYFIWESRYKQERAAVAAQQIAAKTREIRPADPADSERAGTDINPNSIAVLPFANRSADNNDIYFTEGIHDDLLTQLSRIDAFSVIYRTSVMEYRDTTKNLREIARELNVANIMEGAVQRSGQRVRINVQLIDAATDEHLWAEIYDRELTTENLFDIQSEIAQAIAAALQATLTDSELASMADVPTDSVAAYDLYLQARRFFLGETRIGYQTALDLFAEALALDPEFRLAWIGLARAHISNYWVGGGDPADRDRAREAIDRARQMGTESAELYTAEGFYWYWGHLDYERALYNLDKAIELMPGNHEAWMWRGWASRRAGLWDQAVSSMRQAVRLNPRVQFNWVELGGTLVFLHRFDEARSAYEQGRSIDPENFWIKTSMATFGLAESGDVAAAVQLTTGAQHIGEVDFFTSFMNARLFARRFDEALEAARNLPDELEIQRGYIRLREDWAAQVLHYMGRADEARAAADAAWFRLQGLRGRLGDDYRIDRAAAMLSVFRGAGGDEISTRVDQALASAPQDAVEAFRDREQLARTLAMAGLVEDAIEMLEPLLSPPSETSIFMVDLDPSYDGIRDDPRFAAMLERHR